MGHPESCGASHPTRLSIGLPVYNGERYLAQAIQSLLDQTFADFTLILSDNGSTDGTEEICRAYARRDGRIRYHRWPQNRGAAWNFNRVFELAESPYFKWAAHDDLCAPDFVRRCIEVLERTPQAILAYPQSYVIDGDGAIVRRWTEPIEATSPRAHERYRALVRNSGYCHMQFGVIRREILEQTQLHGAYPASDTILLAELALRGELHEIEDPLFYWRDHHNRSVRRYTSQEQLAVFYDPANAGRVILRTSTLLRAHILTLARVPLPAAERLRCAAILCVWGTKQLPKIGVELAGNLPVLLRRIAGRKPATDSYHI